MRSNPGTSGRFWGYHGGELGGLGGLGGSEGGPSRRLGGIQIDPRPPWPAAPPEAPKRKKIVGLLSKSHTKLPSAFFSTATAFLFSPTLFHSLTNFLSSFHISTVTNTQLHHVGNTCRNQWLRPHWPHCVPQCVRAPPCPSPPESDGKTMDLLTGAERDSVEHGDVKVVAVNDPFIEPHYAVSRSCRCRCREGKQAN